MGNTSSQYLTVHGVHLCTAGIVAADILPHRNIAMNVIDGVIDFREEPLPPSLTTMKVFRKDDPVFDGHYPDNPVCPGHWILEAATLTVALFYFCLMPKGPGRGGKKPMLLHADDVTWRAPVKPNDIIFAKASDPVIRSRAFSCSVLITNVHNVIVFKAKEISGLLI